MEERAPLVSGLAGASMLRAAATWQSLGQVNQAMAIYLRVLQRCPGSQEAMAARERLVGLAEDFERGGRLYLAMDLYEKIDRVCQR